LVGTVKSQNFIDWSITKGSIPRANDQREIKQSALLTLYYAHTLDCAVRLFNQLELQEKAKHWEDISKGIKVAVYANCWDKEKQLFKDYPDQQIFSQHTNILAILCDMITPVEQVDLLNRILTFAKFDEVASSYFSFFLFKAMQKTGQEDLFLNHLDFWYKFLDKGYTTCGETGFSSHDRSDCHAWSAHPAYFMLSSVCGIKPADVGFNKTIIEPHIGTLTSLKADMPHPKGRISVEYKVLKEKLWVTINLPGEMVGTFKYKNEEVMLKKGINQFTVGK